MQSLTARLVAELDVLYGLYLLALDRARELEPEDENGTVQLLDARESMLERAASAAGEAARLLRLFESEGNVPAGERALVEEKRRMLQDATERLRQADSRMLRTMHAHLSVLRREMARHSERRDVIRAYITAPAV